ncbi:lymphocyte-specific protein 1 isoform X5 [Camelus bactrianus]|uniref:Lymphocyte-specific protein 1 isoform X5 n=1 Tax=Camelus bactrianus TaxID=9837 RepID=A0AC58QYZ9_CAMBA
MNDLISAKCICSGPAFIQGPAPRRGGSGLPRERGSAPQPKPTEAPRPDLLPEGEVRPGRRRGAGGGPRRHREPQLAHTALSAATRRQAMAEAPSHPGSEEQQELLGDEDAGLTTQWSVEDEEEAARERRRRERDRQLRAQDEDEGDQSPEQLEQEKLLKPSEAPELDEDEGFGDWSQKPEQRQQLWGARENPDCGEPPRGESPERGQEQEDRFSLAQMQSRAGCQRLASPPPEPARPHQHVHGSQGEDELSPGGVCLEELRLSPSSEPQVGLGPEDTEPRGPEGPVQGSPGLAETEEEDKQHQRCQQPRTPSPLVLEGTEPDSPPLSPSTKLIDRTESLNRSIEKSNSMKKSQPALPISKIDERLEQYTQAVETAGRVPKLARQPSFELPSMAVASTKSRWETGEVQAQSAAKSPSCKDIVAGDMSKKSLWEQKGSSKSSSTVKSTPSGKRYKFVATGHGKYEKVLVDEGPAP